LSIKRGHIDLSVEVSVERWGTLRLTLVSFGLVLCVALIYQLIVGGIKIEITGGRLIIDPTGLAYWWHTVTGR
jgi:hypothetical protein